ncbi:hypothetical protein V5H98_09060 [Georgenia sp. M64]
MSTWTPRDARDLALVDAAHRRKHARHPSTVDHLVGGPRSATPELTPS